jgi:hypothetical protein
MSTSGDKPGVALIAGLQHAAVYPHPVTTPIRVAETHISWVLLTGEYAYKIKKPVRLRFLDYSTLERRRTLCEDEVRLNRRFAPALYLGVSAIGGTPAAPVVDGAGQPIEYAVRMRQFRREDELPVLLATGGVGPEDLAALGTAVARFHAGAAIATADSPYGQPDTVHRVTLDNLFELRALPEAEAWQARLSRLAARLDAQQAMLRPLMLRRREDGWVRECHGDLHCGNVVRCADKLTPFDGIEFDPALRYIDVANDTAFLTMDLAERGHLGLRRAALQSWAESLGDWQGLRLLPYYEAYRALVRAKVDALRAGQLDEHSAAREAAVADCCRYLDWAQARLEPRRPPLIITCGLSGSGKTWLARRLAERLGALHLRSDVERKRLAGLAADAPSQSPLDAGIYTREFNDRTYARLGECAAAVLSSGEAVIVDAAFLRRGERRRFLDLAAAAGSMATIVHCHAPQAVLRERIAARTAARNDASEAGLEVLARQPGYWEPFETDEAAYVAAVDTSDPAAVAALLDHLATPAAG